MPRLPQPGSDHGTWGDVLNDFLSQALATNGQLKPDSVGSVQLKDNAVTADAIAPNSITSVALASNAVTAAIIADGSITEPLLDAALQAKLNSGAVVSSVAGKTGTVTLNKTDVGLGNADNTSDENKPVSTAQQTALNGKLDKQSTAFTTAVYTVSGDGTQSTRQAASGSAGASTFVIRDATGGIIIAAPTNASHATTKSYVDTQAATKQASFMTGTVAAASGTVSKTVTLDAPWASYVPAAGDFFFVTFTNGSAVAAATLSINGTAARSLMTPNGSTLNTSLSVAAGNAVLMYYGGGSSYVLVGAPQNTVYAEISQAEIVDTASSTTRLISGRRVEDLMTYEATKERTLTNKTIDGASNILSNVPMSALGTGKVTGTSSGTPTNLTLWTGTAAEYAAIATKDPHTVYVVTP